VAALGYSMAVGIRQLGFTKAADKAKRLWRFRRKVIDVAAAVKSRAPQTNVRLLDTHGYPNPHRRKNKQRLAPFRLDIPLVFWL